MALINDYIKLLEDMVKVNSIYIGTGNGELLADLTIGQIEKMERSYGDDIKVSLPKVYRHLARCYENGLDMKNAKAGDCSGIIVGCLRELGLIKPKSDYRARDLQKNSHPIPLKDVKSGDYVFNKTSESTHVGTYVGDGYVIESRGRDYGVVKRKLTSGSWVIAGRMSWWEDSYPIPEEVKAEDFVLTRILKVTSPSYMRGDDVRYIQTELNRILGTKLVEDGIYGLDTESAVVLLQLKNKLTADGKVGMDTCRVMGITFIG